ncbi:MAG: hypothetical protein N4A43_01500 [Alphaproteobacteria bacterium]|jgi:hypothetical protein|nr:hypothetical protein [Alphaproteobacteria bacterium]
MADIKDDFIISDDGDISDEVDMGEELISGDFNSIEDIDVLEEKTQGIVGGKDLVDDEKDDFLLNKGHKNRKKTKNVDIEKVNRRSKNNITSARTVVIDFLDGTSKKSEAIAYARGFIDNHYPVPADCYMYAIANEGGYAVEIHDGGDGKAYLPEIIKTLQEDPTACICIRNKRRVLEIKKSDKEGFSSILLPEGIDSVETNIVNICPSNTNMTPYSFKALPFALVGMVFGALGFSFLIISLIVGVLARTAPVKTLPVTKVKNLPIQQWDELMNNYSDEKYVGKLSYVSDKWNVENKVSPLFVPKKAEEDSAVEEVSINKEIEAEYILSDGDKAKIDIKIQEEIIEIEDESLSKNEFEADFPQAEVKEDIIENSSIQDSKEIEKENKTLIDEEEVDLLTPPAHPEDLSEIKDIELIEDTLSEEMPPIEEYDLTYPTEM